MVTCLALIATDQLLSQEPVYLLTDLERRAADPEISMHIQNIILLQLTSFQDQLEYMGKQVTGMAFQGEGGQLSPELVKDLQGKLKRAFVTTIQCMLSP